MVLSIFRAVLWRASYESLEPHLPCKSRSLPLAEPRLTEPILPASPLYSKPGFKIKMTSLGKIEIVKGRRQESINSSGWKREGGSPRHGGEHHRDLTRDRSGGARLSIRVISQRLRRGRRQAARSRPQATGGERQSRDPKVGRQTDTPSTLQVPPPRRRRPASRTPAAAQVVTPPRRPYLVQRVPTARRPWVYSAGKEPRLLSREQASLPVAQRSGEVCSLAFRGREECSPLM